MFFDSVKRKQKQIQIKEAVKLVKSKQVKIPDLTDSKPVKITFSDIENKKQTCNAVLATVNGKHLALAMPDNGNKFYFVDNDNQRAIDKFSSFKMTNIFYLARENMTLPADRKQEKQLCYQFLFAYYYVKLFNPAK